MATSKIPPPSTLFTWFNRGVVPWLPSLATYSVAGVTLVMTWWEPEWMVRYIPGHTFEEREAIKAYDHQIALAEEEAAAVAAKKASRA